MGNENEQLIADHIEKLRSKLTSELSKDETHYLFLSIKNENELTGVDRIFMLDYEGRLIRDALSDESIQNRIVSQPKTEDLNDDVDKLLNEVTDSEGSYVKLEENEDRPEIISNEQKPSIESIAGDDDPRNSSDNMDALANMLLDHPDEENDNVSPPNNEPEEDVKIPLSDENIDLNSDLSEDNGVEEHLNKDVESETIGKKIENNNDIKVQVEDGHIVKDEREKLTDEKVVELNKFIDDFENIENDEEDTTAVQEYIDEMNAYQKLPQKIEENRKKIESEESIKVDDETEDDQKLSPMLIEINKRKEVVEKIEQRRNTRNQKLLEKIEKDNEYKDITRYNNKFLNSLMKSNLTIEEIERHNPIEYQNPSTSKEIEEYSDNLERTTKQSVRTQVVLPLSGITCTLECLSPNSVLIMLEKLKAFLNVVDYEPEDYLTDDNQEDENPYSNLDRSRALFDRRKVEFETIYSHLHSIRDREGRVYRPATLQDFLSLVKLPDMDQLFYGIFDATYRDKNRHDCKCKNQIPIEVTDDNGVVHKTTKTCGHGFQYWAKNSEICLLRNDIITRDEMKMLKDGIGGPDFVKNLKVVKLADSVKDIKTANQFVLKLRIPSIQDYLDTMDCLLYSIENGYNTFEDYDMNFLDVPYTVIDRAQDPIVATRYYLLKLMLYTYQILKPVYVKDDKEAESNGKFGLNYHKITKHKDIIEMFNVLGMDVFKLAKDEGLKSLIKLNAVKHFITNIKCPECGNEIDPLPVHFESVFFSTGTASLPF